MSDDNYLDILELEDLTDDQRQLADVIGIEKYRRLVQMYGGSYLYVAKCDAAVKARRNERITDEFNGYNYSELSKRYRLTEIQIRTIVADKAQKIRTAPLGGQTSLFD